MAAAAPQLDSVPLSFTAPTPGAVTMHRASGIVSTCLFGTFNGEWATAAIEGLAFDTLLLTRGSNRPWHGVLGGEPFSVEPHGTLLISYIPQGVRGEMTYFAEANTSSLLMFPPGRLANMMPADSAAAATPIAMLDSARLVALFQMIETEILDPDTERPGHIETLTRMLAQALAERTTPHATGSRAHMDIGPHKLKRVLDYVDDHLDKNVDIATMAEVAGLSRYYFIGIFRRATGRSPYQHLLHRRVAHAQTLIANSDLTLAEIAERSGFANPGHFSTAFKRATGQPPVRYRDLVRRGVPVPGTVLAQP